MALQSRIDYAIRRLHEYLKNEESWGAIHATTLRARPVAYFSMEFGLHESLPIYSGGLGVLAGDHLKSASDLGIPLVGVGILYNQGYFRQSLDDDGWQQETYPNTDVGALPIQPVMDPDGVGERLRVAVETRAGTLHAQVWQVAVGRTTLYLLDSNVPENSEADRNLTARLYGGDARTRIRQEVLLGIGGVRALHAHGIPALGHPHERGPQRLRQPGDDPQAMEDQAVPFGEAVRDIAAMTVFTTHTPVAAGHDRFPGRLVEEHLGPTRDALHLSYEDFLGLGRVNPGDPNEPFCMTVLALKLSRHANGVSALHGAVSRRMWQPAVPGPPRGGGADRPHHQRRPRALLAGPPDEGPVRPPPRPRLADADVRPGDLAGHRDGRGRRAVGGPAGPEGPADRLRPPTAGPPDQPPRRGRRGDRRGPPGARPERPDHRLRPPVRHLQAGHPGPARRRAAGRDRQRRRATGPARLRRQGPPGGPVRQGAHPEHRQGRRRTRGSPAGSSSSRTTT